MPVPWSVMGSLSGVSRHLCCISPGNIWTPLWEELAASTSDPRATILEGTLAQVGGAEVAVGGAEVAGRKIDRVGASLLSSFSSLPSK